MILEVVNIGIPSDPTVPSVFPSSHLSDFPPFSYDNSSTRFTPRVAFVFHVWQSLVAPGPLRQSTEIQAKEKVLQAIENHALWLDGNGVLVH